MSKQLRQPSTRSHSQESPCRPEHMPESQPNSPPLDGLLVADFSRVLAGPLASDALADLGAGSEGRAARRRETRARGDRRMSGRSRPTTPASTATSAASRSIWPTRGDLELAQQLPAGADVLVENYRPGKLAEFGLDAAALAGENPGWSTARSRDSARAGRAPARLRLLAQAVGGLMSITGEPGESAVKVGVAWSTSLPDCTRRSGSSPRCVSGRHRARPDRRGQLLSSLLGSLVNQGAASSRRWRAIGDGQRAPEHRALRDAADRRRPHRRRRRQRPPVRRHGRGRGQAELAADPRFATNRDRVANRPELVAALESALSAHDAAYWTDCMQNRGVPCGPVNDVGRRSRFTTRLGLDPVVHHLSVRRGQ